MAPDGRGLWSVCLCGSYPRGDFVDHNSDLDFHVILGPGNPDGAAPYAAAGYLAVRDLVDRSLGGRRFHSHNPHQFDWIVSAWESIPKNQGQIRLPDGKTPAFPYLSVFLFDYTANLTVLWGSDPRTILPEPLDFAVVAKAWFDAVPVARRRFLDTGQEWRIAFSAMKSVMVAQAALGQRTLDKRRLPALYETHVPPFPLKDFGLRMLDAKAAQRLPEAPCQFRPPAEYAAFEDQLADVVRKALGRPARSG